MVDPIYGDWITDVMKQVKMENIGGRRGSQYPETPEKIPVTKIPYKLRAF